MKTNPLIYFLVTILMIFYGNRIEAGDLYVVTTLPSLASITQSIGGEFIDVYSITRGVQDAHYVEAKPSYMMKLNKADLLVYSGLELEIGWLPLLIQGARNDEVTVGSRGNLNASSALPAEAILERPRGEVDRSMGDVHPMGNPHYLLNPNNAIDVTYLITDKLCELDPEHKSQYRQNSEQFIRQLKKKIDDLQEKADHLRGKELVCYHVHWSYFLGWLGIESAGYIESRPGIPPTPRHKQEIIQMMTEHNIKVVIISTWKEPTRAEEVAESTGATLCVLPGEVGAMEGADDYVSWVEYLTTQLVDAFPAEIQTQQKRKQKRKQERKRGTK